MAVMDRPGMMSNMSSRADPGTPSSLYHWTTLYTRPSSDGKKLISDSDKIHTKTQDVPRNEFHLNVSIVRTLRTRQAWINVQEAKMFFFV